MKLKRVIKDIQLEDVRGSKEVEITGVCANSKLVAPGNLFIAKKGKTVDGSSFIPEAISAGASAILTDIYDPSIKNITQIIHRDVKGVEPLLAAQFNQFPSDHLLMIGVTGTNGKTTTAYMIKHLLDHFRGPCGLVGTIEYVIGKQTYQATHTTPDVATNQKLLREMVNSGCRSAVMEVTSHALEQGRVECIKYDIGIFTNLTPEHLDYHGSMDNYCRAKNKLLRGLNPDGKKNIFPVAIINCDDPYHLRMLEECSVPVIQFAINKAADLTATDICLSPSGTTFQLKYQKKQHSVSMPLIGRYNVYNCLGTIACGISQGFPIEEIIEAVKTFPRVPARLEPVSNELGLQIYVDFAHKPDALKNVLLCLKEFNTGRIYTVFGCGGDRDKSKRSVMAEVAEQFSDLTIVTTDNPRSEDPETIVKEIVQGFRSTNSYIIECDRRKAIEKAIALATPNDIILIAGKGHETYQIFAHHTIEFDDRIVVKKVCNERATKG